MSRYVDLSEKVTATYYDEQYEEWDHHTVTVEDVLNEVCDDYTVLPSVQSEDVARDIATIIENEKDMRVILANGQTGWIPVTEALPENGHYYLKCTKYGNVDVDYYWDGFENATKYGEEIVAWMEKPKPYKGRQDGTT